MRVKNRLLTIHFYRLIVSRCCTNSICSAVLFNYCIFPTHLLVLYFVTESIMANGKGDMPHGVNSTEVDESSISIERIKKIEKRLLELENQINDIDTLDAQPYFYPEKYR